MNRPVYLDRLTKGQIISKNHLMFKVGNTEYIKQCDGDERLHIFNRVLTNVYLEQFEEVVGSVPVYDDITYISTLENHEVNITQLPNSLVGLFVMSSLCEQIQFSPANYEKMQSIVIDKSNMSVLPNITPFKELKVLRINHSNLQRFNPTELPHSLTKLNLYTNSITNTEFNYDVLVNKTTTCKYNFSDNQLNYDLFPTELARKCNLIKQYSYKWNQITFRNVNEEHVRNFVQQVGVDTTNILDNKQTVHLSSVNNSVAKSVDVIEQFIKQHSIVVNMKLTTKVLQNNNSWWQWFGTNTHDLTPYDDVWKTTQSVTQKTFGETFCLVVSVMNYLADTKQFDKKDMYERLFTELNDGKDMCFTGKYNRLVNSLVGYIDGIYVGISSQEELGLEMGIIVAKINKSAGDVNVFKEEMCKAEDILLLYSKNNENADVSSWMDALLDLAPDPQLLPDNQYLMWNDYVTNCLVEKNIIGFKTDDKIVYFTTI